ncbi:hypothetical protein OG21DRAFT_1517609 [Imleria badia]|nr:hypothetical protein OG21DRAFT_1517609 [Imleria badia]
MIFPRSGEEVAPRSLLTRALALSSFHKPELMLTELLTALLARAQPKTAVSIDMIVLSLILHSSPQLASVLIDRRHGLYSKGGLSNDWGVSGLGISLSSGPTNEMIELSMNRDSSFTSRKVVHEASYRRYRGGDVAATDRYPFKSANCLAV